MNTTANTQSRRRSLSGYETMLHNREQRKTLETTTLDEQNRKATEQMELDSQKNINILCGNIQNEYDAMVKCGKDMRRKQDELAEKRKEEKLFLATEDENYNFKDVDESVLRKMKMRKIAYYALPALDTFFAWFALYPIITSKSEDLSSIGCNPIVVGVVASIVVGLTLSLLSRMAAAFYEKKGKRILGFLPVVAAMICLPLMYIIGEVAFNGGESWTYSGGFAFVSFVIQLLIVTGYDKQNEAFTYFRNKNQNDSLKSVKDADEKAIRDEIKSVQEKIIAIENAFDSGYNRFKNEFRELAAARDEFIRAFGNDAKYYLNQMTIYIGNLVCFRNVVIPFHYDANGRVSTIPFVDFPHADGGQAIFVNSDFVYLDYMLKQSQGISLSETIQMIEANRHPGLEPSKLEDAGPAEFSSSDDLNSPKDSNKQDPFVTEDGDESYGDDDKDSIRWDE